MTWSGCRLLLARPVAVLRLALLALGLVVLPAAAGAAAADAPWTLDPAASTFTFQSVKKNSVVESNIIRTFVGAIEPDGAATVTIDLNSIDTGIDLRNVRMRFLFFETFKHPTATLTATVDPAVFADLPALRRVTVPLTYTLALHGVEKTMTSDVVVTLLTDQSVSVASHTPIFIKAEDFALLEGITKLQEAANVTAIVPVASVSFDFVFRTEGPGLAPPAGAAQPVAAVAVTAPAAGEIRVVMPGAAVTGEGYTDEECGNRFESLSMSGAIYFGAGSSDLKAESRPLLDEAAEVIRRCPEIAVQISGHTDSDGAASWNRLLSARRAEAVAAYIVAKGIPAGRVSAIGYGAERPVAPNDTAEGKARNRRIEFAAKDPAP